MEAGRGGTIERLKAKQVDMSVWAFDSEELLTPSRSDNRARPSTERSKPRRVFFGDGEPDAAALDARSNSNHESVPTASRRTHRITTTELVVDDSDEASPQKEHDHRTTNKSATTKQSATAAYDVQQMPIRISVAVNDSTSRHHGKSEEIATADIVRRTSETSKTAETQLESVNCQYVHWLVRDFLAKTYPRNVVDMFDKEMPAPTASAEIHHAVQALHTRIVAGIDTSQSTSLEQTVFAWDERVHHKQLVRPRARRRESLSTSDQLPTAETPGVSVSSKAKNKSSCGSRKKPQLSVTIASDPISPSSSRGGDGISDDTGFNRLNHPGHTPKAQDALLAAVIGQPGSTPKASTSDLKALGFEDLDDTPSIGPMIPTPSKPTDYDDDDDDDADELSKYAHRKRAARRHNKHVYIGEPGRTPTKEYVFFRETPPRYVTESIDAAEDVLRSIGGDPDARRQHAAQAAHIERFVELQSSDVAKYAVGQRVANLGAQRNITGLVAKLYGSRQCGLAGPGTVVIDTWEGSDTAPMADPPELLSVASRPSTPASGK